jgi:hypothetical protein
MPFAVNQRQMQQTAFLYNVPDPVGVFHFTVFSPHAEHILYAEITRRLPAPGILLL